MVRWVLIIALFILALNWSIKPVLATTTIEQQINITDQEFYTTSTTDYPTDNSLGLFRWESDSYTGATVYFEAVLNSTSTYTTTATLYTSDGSAVSGSSVSVTGTVFYTRVRSSAITLTDGVNYTVRVKSTSTGGAAHMKLARLIIVQADSTKLTNTESQIEIGNSEGTSNTSYTILTDKKIYRYDSSKFSPAPTAYFEASFRAASPKLEQQINIIDQEFFTTSTTDYPTDNSLGLFRWESDSYTGATVYF